jgi:iron complex transport system permease protein
MNLRAPLGPTLLLAGLCLAAAALALVTGPLEIPASHVWASLTGLGGPAGPTETATVLDIRLPRVLLALLIGAALAQAGAALQGLVRNPLAEPGLVGISSGAALAAASITVLAPPLFDVIPARLVLPAVTFIGGAAAAALVLRLARIDGTTRPGALLLAGLALNAIAGAGIGLFTQLASDQALRSLTFWMFGSLGKAGWPELAVAAPMLLAAIVLIPREAGALNAMLLGEPEAGHLGVDVEALKRRLTLLIVLAAAASVALAGIIAFVGLVVPHLVRLWRGPDHRELLPLSALLGALLLILADTASRTLLAPAELPIGILTALVGGPFFLALLLRHRAELEA